MKRRDIWGRRAATRWLHPEDLRLQEEFRRLLGIPPSLRVPLISRIEGDRIWLARDMRGGSCLLPALVLAGTLLVPLYWVIQREEGAAVIAGILLAITALALVVAVEKATNPESALLDLGKGTLAILGRWRSRPGEIRRYGTKDLYLYIRSTALTASGEGETPRGVTVSAVHPHPDEWETPLGVPQLDQFLLATSDLPEDLAAAEIEPGLAALLRSLPWKGVVKKLIFTIEEPPG